MCCVLSIVLARWWLQRGGHRTHAATNRLFFSSLISFGLHFDFLYFKCTHFVCVFACKQILSIVVTVRRIIVNLIWAVCVCVCGHVASLMSLMHVERQHDRCLCAYVPHVHWFVQLFVWPHIHFNCCDLFCLLLLLRSILSKHFSHLHPTITATATATNKQTNERKN